MSCHLCLSSDPLHALAVDRVWVWVCFICDPGVFFVSDKTPRASQETFTDSPNYLELSAALLPGVEEA